MSFPSQKQLNRARNRLAKMEGTLVLPEGATALEKFRWDLCQKFIQYKIKNQLTQDELADILGVDKAKVSKILHHRIEDFSTDRLIKLYQALNPHLELKVS